MKKRIMLWAGNLLLLTGCAGVKNDFDCEITTSDTCMTMSQANQVARDKTKKQAEGRLPVLANVTVASAISPVPSLAAGIPVVLPVKPLWGTPLAGKSVTTSPRHTTPEGDSCNPVYPQRTQDRVASIWIAPWIDRDNNVHQPGRVSFVVTPGDWVLPSGVQ